jgi:hypothetical protein
MDRNHGRRHSNRSPSLTTQLDGSHASSDAALSSPHPPRTHSHDPAPSFLAQPSSPYGGTWTEYLLEHGHESIASRTSHTQQYQLAQAQQQQQQRHLPQIPTYTDAHVDTNRRLPPLPHETYLRDSRSAFLDRPHPTEPSTSSTDRKRRLTTADSPMRRPSGRRAHEGSAASGSGMGGSAENPIVLDSPFAPSPSTSALPPPQQQYQSRNQSLNSLAQGSTGTRRGSEFVLPPWQPDTAASHCFVCGSQFTFFYRKHHCRYVVEYSSPLALQSTSEDELRA